MTNKLTIDERKPILFHVDGLLDEAVKLIAAQKINREQMLIIEEALVIVRDALEMDT